MTALVAAAAERGVAAVFGFCEGVDDAFLIAQAVACYGRLVTVQRNRRLGDDEIGYTDFNRARLVRPDR